jgi:hypothetical protein
VAALTGAGLGPGPAGLEFLDPEVVEAALSVLARKTRAELILGLLEDCVANRRSGHAVLADFRLGAGTAAPVRSRSGSGCARSGGPRGEPVVEWEIFHGLNVHRHPPLPHPAPRRERPERGHARDRDGPLQSRRFG